MAKIGQMMFISNNFTVQSMDFYFAKGSLRPLLPQKAVKIIFQNFRENDHLGRYCDIATTDRVYKTKSSISPCRACGLMDKAPDFGSGDCRFESCHARANFDVFRLIVRKFNTFQ